MQGLPNILTQGLMAIAIAMAIVTGYDFWDSGSLQVNSRDVLSWLAMFGLIIIPLDGLLAEKLNAKSKRGEHLQSRNGGALCIVAGGILLLTGTWPWWTLVLLGILFGGLQLIHELADRNVTSAYPLKAVQQWVHPLFATILYVTMVFQFVWEASHDASLLLILGCMVIIGVILRRNHLFELIEEGKNWRAKSA